MTTASGHAHLLRGKPIIGKKQMAVSTHLFSSVGQTWELDKADAHLEMESLKQIPEASISVCHFLLSTKKIPIAYHRPVAAVTVLPIGMEIGT